MIDPFALQLLPCLDDPRSEEDRGQAQCVLPLLFPLRLETQPPQSEKLAQDYILRLQQCPYPRSSQGELNFHHSILPCLPIEYANLEQVLVILGATVLAGLGVWGNLLLRQEFQIRWFFPKGTYLDKFLDKNEEYFPFGGVRGTVFFHDVDFAAELGTVQSFVEDLRGQTDIVDAVDSWTDAFLKYSNNHFGTNLPGEALNKVIIFLPDP